MNILTPNNTTIPTSFPSHALGSDLLLYPRRRPRLPPYNFYKQAKSQQLLEILREFSQVKILIIPIHSGRKKHHRVMPPSRDFSSQHSLYQVLCVIYIKVELKSTCFSALVQTFIPPSPDTLPAAARLHSTRPGNCRFHASIQAAKLCESPLSTIRIFY